MITYEFPVNEKIRTFLRLESLYKRAKVYNNHNDSENHHAGLLTIFEILEVTGRSELKSEVMQELEKQKNHLIQLKDNPSVEPSTADAIIDEIEHSSQLLLHSQGKAGQEIRQNDWLASIKQRTSIPGGVCQFDLPSYHYWLSSDSESRKKDLERWLQPFEGLASGIVIILKILRKSSSPEIITASNGNFQKTLSGKIAQLIQIKIASPSNLIPEVSANKYLLNVRFTIAGEQSKKQTQEKVNFELGFCNLL
mgnify:CR=1 FL=1